MKLDPISGLSVTSAYDVISSSTARDESRLDRVFKGLSHCWKSRVPSKIMCFLCCCCCMIGWLLSSTLSRCGIVQVDRGDQCAICMD